MGEGLLHIARFAAKTRIPHAIPVHLVQATRLTLGNNLALLGPVFPTSWVQPGALPSLTYLNLMNNAGLAGTLPEGLPWPNVASL